MQLADVELARNNFGPQEGAQQMELQLPGLTALTRLSLSQCQLDSLPPSLSALCSLQELDLSENLFNATGPEGPDCLQQLTGLTSWTSPTAALLPGLRAFRISTG